MGPELKPNKLDIYLVFVLCPVLVHPPGVWDGCVWSEVCVSNT